MSPSLKTDNPTERTILFQVLNLQRSTLLWKLDGLTADQLQAIHPPSTLTLIGLVKHLARVERSWLQQDLLGPDIESFVPPADEWHLEPDETCAAIIDDYRRAIRRSDHIVAGISLDAVLVDPHPDDAGVTLRGALLHMIEETARHCGHADLIREAIDGATGNPPAHA